MFKTPSRFRQQRTLLLATPVGTVTIAANNYATHDGSTAELQVTSYTHLFDQCTQDWFAVASIIEDLPTHVKMKQPGLKSVFLRSEAGCYHNNFLITAVGDIGQRVGVAVEAYDFSEPQSRRMYVTGFSVL